MTLPAQDQTPTVERLILFLPTQHALRICLPFDPSALSVEPFS